MLFVALNNIRNKFATTAVLAAAPFVGACTNTKVKQGKAEQQSNADKESDTSAEVGSVVQDASPAPNTSALDVNELGQHALTVINGPLTVTNPQVLSDGTNSLSLEPSSQALDLETSTEPTRTFTLPDQSGELRLPATDSQKSSASSVEISPQTGVIGNLGETRTKNTKKSGLLAAFHREIQDGEMVKFQDILEKCKPSSLSVGELRTLETIYAKAGTRKSFPAHWNQLGIANKEECLTKLKAWNILQAAKARLAAVRAGVDQTEAKMFNGK